MVKENITTEEKLYNLANQKINNISASFKQRLDEHESCIGFNKRKIDSLQDNLKLISKKKTKEKNNPSLDERISCIESEVEQLEISHKIMMDQMVRSISRQRLELIGIWFIAALSGISIILWLMVILEVL